MRPIQLWLPTVTSSLGEPAVQADMMRAIQSWEGQRTLWLLPDITEPVSWSQGPTLYDMLRAVPAEHLVQPAGITQRVPRATVSQTWQAIWFSYTSTESVLDADSVHQNSAGAASPGPGYSENHSG